MVSQSARAGNGGITGMGHGTRAGAVPQAALQASMIHRQHLLAGWVAWAATVMLVVAVLANGSLVDETVTRLSISSSAPVGAVIEMPMIIRSSGAMSSVTSQVTTPARWLHVASVDVADLNTDPAGNVSTTTTSSAVCNPMLSTVI